MQQGESRETPSKRVPLGSRGMRHVETLATIIIVLIFFSFFALLLTKLFVPGTSLQEMLRKSDAPQAEQSGDAGRDAMLDVGGKENNLGDVFRKAAVLILARNEVKTKRADSIAWSTAKPGMALYNHDSVQTFRDALAQITIDKKNSFTMGSNSLVIIKRMEKDPFQNEHRSAMVLLEGELRGKIAPGDNSLNLEVSTPGAVAKLSGSTGQKTDFRVSANRDQTSSIAVFHGQAEVTAGGKVVKIPENMSVIVKPGEAPGALVPLLLPPAQASPAHKGMLAYRHLPPKVDFSWSPVPGADAFRLQISRDPEFKEIIVDKTLQETSFSHGNMKPGTYFWRVNCVKKGCEGRYSETRSIELVQKLAEPKLLVQFPSGPLAEDHFTLTGMTEPGVRLFLMGKPVTVSESGAFTQVVMLRQGTNLVTVEAVDAAGNVAYRSQYVRRGAR